MSKYLKISLITSLLIIVSFVSIPRTYASAVTLYNVPTNDSSLHSIVSGRDGNLWFSEKSGQKIGRISTNGLITEFSIPSNSDIEHLVMAEDGIIWFTALNVQSKIGRLTPLGDITLYNIPYAGSHPEAISVGSDGNIWYADSARNTINRVTTEGDFTAFTIPTPDSYPISLTLANDDNIWFTEYVKQKVSRITPEGVITEFDVDVLPGNIIQGKDGNLWFTAPDDNKVGKINLSGQVTLYDIPGYAYSWNITAGSDGNIWITNELDSQLLKVSSNGNITDITISSAPIDISSGPDGNIWFTDRNANKIGKYIISGSVPTITPTPPSVLQVKDYKQTDPRWGSKRLDNSSNCGTLYSFGCAVTSVANVFFSYGKTNLPNNISLDPGTLNTWLSGTAGGFVGCAINWGKASNAFNTGAPVILFRNGNAAWSNGINAIDTALANGELAILGLAPSPGKTHFLVVDKKLPDINGKPDYRLVDPALYPFTANNPGNTGKSFSQAYGSFDKVYEAVIYKKNSTPQKSLTIRAHSPVQLRITDPEGNVTGYNPVSSQIEENISQSSYGVEYGIAPVDGSQAASEETKYFQQIEPIEGQYKIEVIGTGNGSYTLDVTNTDENANSSTEILTGNAHLGITEVYNLEYFTDATESPTVYKEITFSTLKSDIKSLYTQKQIKNKIFYSALLLQTEIAEKATLINRQPLGNKLAIITLKAMQIELNKQKGKSITVEGYQILYRDLTDIIKSLQDNQEPSNGSGSSGGS